MSALARSTGHTWTATKKPRNDEGCGFAADNGNIVNADVHENPDSEAAFTSSKSRCDSGTLQEQPVADGAYVCLLEGRPVALLLIKAKNVLVDVTPFSFKGISNEDIEKVLSEFLAAYTPPS